MFLRLSLVRPAWLFTTSLASDIDNAHHNSYSTSLCRVHLYLDAAHGPTTSTPSRSTAPAATPRTTAASRRLSTSPRPSRRRSTTPHSRLWCSPPSRHPTFPSAHSGMASPHPRSPRACSTSHPRPAQRLVRRVGDGPRYDRRATQAGGEHDVRGQTSRSRSWPSARSKLCAPAPPAATRPVAERAAETDQQGHRCGRFLLHVC
ncbi:hypothetical protein B0H14DRAFT_2968957 [Mycena olivaceomarginata]|nr:hypothetical protein B0H14DRAFT_2968957 [Mycena olivaceomarginata]